MINANYLLILNIVNKFLHITSLIPIRENDEYHMQQSDMGHG
jgi:hypothetical protein